MPVAALLGASQTKVLAQQIQQRYAHVNRIEPPAEAVDAEAKVNAVRELGCGHRTASNRTGVTGARFDEFITHSVVSMEEPTADTVCEGLFGDSLSASPPGR